MSNSFPNIGQHPEILKLSLAFVGKLSHRVKLISVEVDYLVFGKCFWIMARGYQTASKYSPTFFVGTLQKIILIY
jgi:hypothetical protein